MCMYGLAPCHRLGLWRITDIEDRANEFFTAAIGVGVEDVKLAKVRPISKVQWNN